MHRGQGGRKFVPVPIFCILNNLEQFLNTIQAPGVKQPIYDENMYVFLKLCILLYDDDPVILSEEGSHPQNALKIFQAYFVKD